LKNKIRFLWRKNMQKEFCDHCGKEIISYDDHSRLWLDYQYKKAIKKINIEEFKDKVYKDYCNICGIEIIEKILEIANSNQ